MEGRLGKAEGNDVSAANLRFVIVNPALSLTKMPGPTCGRHPPNPTRSQCGVT
jgi:hypothetical protein